MCGLGVSVRAPAGVGGTGIRARDSLHCGNHYSLRREGRIVTRPVLVTSMRFRPRAAQRARRQEGKRIKMLDRLKSEQSWRTPADDRPVAAEDTNTGRHASSVRIRSPWLAGARLQAANCCPRELSCPVAVFVAGGSANAQHHHPAHRLARCRQRRRASAPRAGIGSADHNTTGRTVITEKIGKPLQRSLKSQDVKLRPDDDTALPFAPHARPRAK